MELEQNASWPLIYLESIHVNRVVILVRYRIFLYYGERDVVLLRETPPITPERCLSEYKWSYTNLKSTYFRRVVILT